MNSIIGEKNYAGKIAYNKNVAENYEKDRIVEQIWQKEQEWVNQFIESLEPGSVILDLPIGTGRFFPIYAKKNFSILGADISVEMLKEANNKLESLKDSSLSKISLHQMDAEKLDLKNNSIDYLICFRLFHLMPIEVIARVLGEFYRVTNKKVVIEIYDSSIINDSNLNLVQRFKGKLRSFFKPKVNNLIEKNAPLTPWSGIANFQYSFSLLKEKIKNVGFKIEKQIKINDSENSVSIFILSK